MPITEAEALAACPSQGFLRRYIDYASTCTDANVIYHVGTGLALLAAVAPFDLFLPFGRPLRSNVFVLLVGDSTDSRKSASINTGRNLLKQVMMSAVGEEPGSTEGFVESIRSAPKQVVFYEEFGAFLSKAEDGYLAPIKTMMNTLYDSAPLGRALAKKRGVVIENPRVSILAGGAPSYLERHTEPTDWTGGFLARWITFAGVRERLYEIPPTNWELGEALILELKTKADMLNCGKPLDRGFSPEAMVLWSNWFRDVAARKSSSETRAAVARAPGMCLKIAMLLAFDYGDASEGYDWRITAGELIPAIAITELHIKSILEIGNLLAASRDMRDRRTVLSCVSQIKPMKLGLITHAAKMMNKRVKDLLDMLTLEGMLHHGHAPDGTEAWIQIPGAAQKLMDELMTYHSSSAAGPKLSGSSGLVDSNGAPVASGYVPPMEDF